MKKTLTVNLGGTVFHIDEDAYQLLDKYLSNRASTSAKKRVRMRSWMISRCVSRNFLTSVSA